MHQVFCAPLPPDLASSVGHFPGGAPDLFYLAAAELQLKKNNFSTLPSDGRHKGVVSPVAASKDAGVVPTTRAGGGRKLGPRACGGDVEGGCELRLAVSWLEPC